MPELHLNTETSMDMDMDRNVDVDGDVNMGWDGTAGNGGCRHVSAEALSVVLLGSQATPLRLAFLVVTVFSLTRDGMRLRLRGLCCRGMGSQEDSPVSLFPSFYLWLVWSVDRAPREGTAESRWRWGETPDC